MACAKGMGSQSGKEKIEEYLKCSICFEVFSSPRSLSCLHTFCEQCISSHITKCMENSSFKDGIECPICRQTTRIPEQGKSPEEFSKSLPLNYTILPLLESLTLDDSTNDPVCMSCRDNCTTCFAICENCSGVVCPVCDEMHKKLLIFKNHKIVRIGGPHITICVKHQNKGLDYYCQDHEEILCSTCAVVDHRSCSKIYELKDIATCDRLQDKCMSIKKDLRLLQSTVSEKIHQILSSHDTVKISCAETDTQEEKIEKSFAEYKKKKESYLEKCEEKAKECLLACQNCLEKINAVTQLFEMSKKSPQTTDRFLILKDFAANVQVLKNETNHLEGIPTEFNLDCPVTFKKSIAGNVVSEDKEDKCTQTDDDFEPPTARSIASPLAELNEAPIDINVQLKNEKMIFGCEGQKAVWYICLVSVRHGHYVAFDNQNNECCLMNENCSVLYKLPILDLVPKRICAKDQNSVIVLAIDFRVCFVGIDYVNKTLAVQRSTVMHFCGDFYDNSDCLNIDMLNVSDIVICANTDIIIFDESQNQKSKITFDTTDIDVRKEKMKSLKVNQKLKMIYISDFQSNTVLFYSYGMEQFITLKKVKAPVGIDFDSKNNVYVCSQAEDCVVVFSPKGKFIKKIHISKMYQVSTICFDESRRKFWVTNRGSPEKLLQYEIVDYKYDTAQ